MALFARLELGAIRKRRQIHQDCHVGINLDKRVIDQLDLAGQLPFFFFLIDIQSTPFPTIFARLFYFLVKFFEVNIYPLSPKLARF